MGQQKPAKERTIANYNRLSAWYDAIAGTGENRLRKTGLLRLAPAPGERILEVGFGTGRSLLELAQAVGSSGRVYGIDISDRMLSLAGRRVTASGYSSTVELVCGDALALPYPPDWFDAIFISFTLEVFPSSDTAAFLRRCMHVLRPGGRIGVVAISSQGKHGLMMRAYEWAHATFPGLVDCRPIGAARCLRDAGFAVPESEVTSLWGLSVEILLAKKIGQVQ